MCHISIVIPLYNKEKYIARAIKSILNQTIQQFEIIIIDDGSKDKSCDIVRSFKDSRIKLIHQYHMGVSVARNRGIEMAQADIIAFLDADDEWKPTFLKTIFKLRKKYPDSGVYATCYEIILKNGKKIHPVLKNIPSSPWEGRISHYIHSVLGDLPLISSAIAIPKSVFKNIGTFPIGSQLGEDQDMWFRIAQKYPIIYSNTVQSTYYRGLPYSLCTNLTLKDPYPIIKTIENTLKLTSKENDFYLKEYLAKLQLDFSKRLLQANELTIAKNIIAKCDTKQFVRWKTQLLISYYFKKCMKFIIKK
ncbi:hypothetical protein BM74_12455 [Bacillus thuringiensis]|uniref:Glycosyltransferase 2-like domain-containing protein n=1 Tax=Bacillus thuringiensis TaxID=1428 RepID=A0A437SKW9_BACTU|nr:glycosyltransferase family 2 protein [Bacillus thuringiensis]RVU63915.1 hypothetical protein BM74_12455 [Bacillus thuringiensis]